MKLFSRSAKMINLLILSALITTFYSCKDDEDEAETITETIIVEKDIATFQVRLNMKQKVNGQDLQLNTVNRPYTNALGQKFNVTRLRYLISDLTFHMNDGNSFIIDDYHFVDAADSSTFVYQPDVRIPAGIYNKISFKFGFDRIDNAKNYPELDAVSWGWPRGVGMTPDLGGGYHFMQLEGTFDSSMTVSKVFLTHMGTARSIVGTDTTFEDNHFVAYPTISPLTVNNNLELDLVMNVEQWYTDPYDWDFNVYRVMVMPNYNAQRKLNLNGPSVFTIE